MTAQAATSAGADPLHVPPAQYARVVVDGPNGEESWSAQRWNTYIDACKDSRTGGEIIFRIVRLEPARHPSAAARTEPGEPDAMGTLIRRAATVIRERARAATSGDWYDSPEVTHGFHVNSSHQGRDYSVAWTGDGEDDEGNDTTAYADMLHIATLDPKVTLTLAAWLDAVDKDHPLIHDAGECPTCGTGTCAPHPDTDSCAACDQDYPCATARPAYELAAAYLTAAGALEPAPASAGERATDPLTNNTP